MSRETLLDEAIVKAKEAEDWQLVEWLRMARSGENAAKWYTEKLRELEDENARLRSCMSDDSENARMIIGENAKLRELAKLAVHSACFGCPHNDKKAWRSCEGCSIYEKATELGIEVKP